MEYSDEPYWVFGLSNGMRSCKEKILDLEIYYIDCERISEIQITELEYGDWGKMLIGLRLIDD